VHDLLMERSAAVEIWRVDAMFGHAAM